MESEEMKRQRRALLKALTAIPASALVPRSSACDEEGEASARRRTTRSIKPNTSSLQAQDLDEHEWKTAAF